MNWISALSLGTDLLLGATKINATHFPEISAFLLGSAAVAIAGWRYLARPRP